MADFSASIYLARNELSAVARLVRLWLRLIDGGLGGGFMGGLRRISRRHVLGALRLQFEFYKNDDDGVDVKSLTSRRSDWHVVRDGLLAIAK